MFNNKERRFIGVILQEKAKKKAFISSKENGFSIGTRRQKGSIFPYMPAIGYKWSGYGTNEIIKDRK